MAPLAEDLILGKEHAVDTAHEAAALAVQIRVDFFFKRGLVQVAGADGDTERDGFFLRLASDILVDGDGGVDAALLFEKTADCSAGAFGCNKDHVNVFRDVNFGKVFEDRGEAMGEVEGLTFI